MFDAVGKRPVRNELEARGHKEADFLREVSGKYLGGGGGGGQVAVKMEGGERGWLEGRSGTVGRRINAAEAVRRGRSVDVHDRGGRLCMGNGGFCKASVEA